jgi:capsular exopolysaccharide synthesis family protein
MPVLAHVPTLSPTRAGGLDVAAYVLKRPDSAFAEAIRSIFTRLLLAQSDQPPQVVLLLSAEADEGKSTIALSIARQQAQGGRRVVLVDSDFRRSRLAHRVAGLEPKPGLSELLTGKASVDEIIQADPKSSANVVVAGETALDNFDLAGSPVFRDFLDDLRRRYDLVVVDAPPVLALTDAHVVAALADATVMVIRWGKTRRRVARYAIAQISRFGGRINGVALSMVDVRRMAGYGYGDSGYYYGKAAKYYTK